MTLRQRIENNPIVWLLSTLLVGFLAGFGAYRTIVEVSSQIIVSKAEYERTTQTASRVPELEKQISSLKAKEGKTPSGHGLFISSRVVEDRPKDILSKVRLNATFYLSSKWLGLSGKGYYEQKWQVLSADGLVAENWHPFVPKEDGEYWTWAAFTLRSGELTTGKYRIRIFLNNERFEDRELLVLNN